MNRQDLLNKLERYAPNDPAEIDSRQRIIDFVRSTPDCFKREHLAGHITGSAWLIDEDRGNVLLTHHRKLDKWLQLGGHCDGDADVLNVALTEAVEESGIQNVTPVSPDIFDLDVHPIPARGDVPEHFHYDIRFLCRIDGDPTFVVSDESHELAWLSPDAILEMTVGQSIIRMRQKWLEHMRQS